ncbi:MAG: L-seryl-tRNA(Sec) selenium transferase [Pseudomonadota bacterium]
MNKNLRNIPSVNELLQHPELELLINEQGRELVTYAIRKVVDEVREKMVNGSPSTSSGRTVNNSDLNKQIIAQIISLVANISGKSLKPVINATGIVLHTNLGRAPIGEIVLKDAFAALSGYSNLEFDLSTGKRGKRSSHIIELIKYLTLAEDAVVVNNNAAGIVLALNTLARGKEVIISRGELVEIGGSFRIPEIMRAAGVKMKEVGTTNKTHLKDYENAITEKTALIFKAHKSNYAIKGFAKEVGVAELAQLAATKNLPLVYDIGSGLLRRPEKIAMQNEPDIRSALQDGADLVAFSCDKLLGGPQAGIVAGRKNLVQKLAKAPMMRALRVGKITLAIMASAFQNYLNDKTLLKNNPLFVMLKRSESELEQLAKDLAAKLEKKGVAAKVIKSTAQCGGGSLPELELPSFAVQIKTAQKAEKMYFNLLQADRPVVGILRKGELLLDVYTLFENDIPLILTSISS